MKKITALLLALALVLSLVACAPAEIETTAPATQQSPSESTTPSESTQATEPEDTAITITDQAGREVILEKPAETIVSCYYITTYACMALGVDDRIIGLEKKADSRPIYHMAAPELLELPNVGSLKEFNVEAAAALEPDLLIMPKKLKDHAQTLTDLCIAVLVVDPETQEGMEQMLTLIAKLCGVEEKAQALLSYYQETLENLPNAGLLSTVLSVYMGSNSSYLETAPAAMYQSDLIYMASGMNVAAKLEGDYWTEVSYETIITWNPDVIVIPCGASYTREDILNDVNLADVAAVKNGAVYQMPKGIEEWDSPVPSGALGVLWMYSVLYPGFYPFEDFQADVVSFYQTFYGFTIDTDLITK